MRALHLVMAVGLGLVLAGTFSPRSSGAEEKGKGEAAPYGDISDLKLLKPEDKVDVQSTPAPSGAIVLFDGKSLDHWERRDGKGSAPWKLLDGGIMQVQESDIV